MNDPTLITPLAPPSYRNARRHMVADLKALHNRWTEDAQRLTQKWENFLPPDEPPPPSLNTERAAEVMEHLYELLELLHEPSVPIEVRHKFAKTALHCIGVLEAPIEEETHE